MSPEAEGLGGAVLAELEARARGITAADEKTNRNITATEAALNPRNCLRDFK